MAQKSPKNDVEILNYQQQRINIKWARGSQRLAIVNFTTEDHETKFGNTKVKGTLETQELPNRNQGQSKKKEPKKQIQNFKFDIYSSKKRNKKFSVVIPKNRGVKKNYENTLHFVIEFSKENSLLTVIEDYSDAKMTVRGGRAEKITTEEYVERQKRKLDGRRKDDDHVMERQKQEQQEEDSSSS